MIPETLSGQFHRIVFEADHSRLLQGVISSEGRFHHSGQAAFYMSPTPETAAIAVATYLRQDDPPRITVPLLLENARILDLRRADVLAHLGLTGAEPAIPWQPQRATGLRASTWLASDAVRNGGADGMIYTSRTDPSRWHLVLFRWNVSGSPIVRQNGPPMPFEVDKLSNSSP